MADEILSPYQHELNGQGTDCVDDCPACTWASEQCLVAIEQRLDVEELERLLTR